MPNVEVRSLPSNVLDLNITRDNIELVLNSSVDENGSASILIIYKDDKELFDTDFYMVPVT